MALETTPENPAPVRVIAESLRAWIARLGNVWVEGQVAEISIRDRMTYLTLRDTEVEMSLRVHLPTSVVTNADVAVDAGARVIVEAKPEFWAKNGSLSLRGSSLRAVGIGELLARIEQLKTLLEAEGLFDASRKKPLPFLPRRIGLICGRNSDAMHDVLENARLRWPSIDFEIREVAVQGNLAVPQIISALEELSDVQDVDVIVIARGGGSVEDLLPFSNEGLVRAVSQCIKPVVSAIGHEKDSPILDLVADLRASTPTDAARRIVPDLAEQTRIIGDLRARNFNAVAGRVQYEREWLMNLRARPIMKSPFALIDDRQRDITDLVSRSRSTFGSLLDRALDQVAHVQAHVRAVSPQATLERGYAVVRRADGSVIASVNAGDLGEHLSVRVKDGEFGVIKQ